ncbi:MAG TPA: twin-arginine translocase subunit TatC [Candidatus Saccharibacteria bacterium]|nr:twin-arginine translocase subunit TatC [Candidatus Saccharibacteria bacterium]
MDHVRELQGRLFATGIAFIVFAAAAYPFFDVIVNFLLAPLGENHELVYLTPAGAFSFIIQVCMYVGFVVVLPIVIYNVYRFIMPVMKKTTTKVALGYTIASFLLALVGMAFAYYVSLPAALYFLTGFDLYHINPMLTIDSYFSFIMVYMIVGALLFQIPLVMLIINGAKPLQPKRLMRHQGKIILGSFIIAAIVSPTPDALNQSLLASPMIVMYQIGIILVLLKNRRPAAQPVAISVAGEQGRITPAVYAAIPKAAQTVGHIPAAKPTPAVSTNGMLQQPGMRLRSVDGFAIAPPQRAASRQRPMSHLQRSTLSTLAGHQTEGRRPAFSVQSRPRSLDGFTVL